MAGELKEEIAIELEAMSTVVAELLALKHDIGAHDPTLREKTAAAGFLAQFYNGLENILKRISLYHGVPLPTGETWHTELFQRFTVPPFDTLPGLFGSELALKLAPYRRFRHIVLHSYGFQLEWGRMDGGIEGIGGAYDEFRGSVQKYLQTID